MENTDNYQESDKSSSSEGFDALWIEKKIGNDTRKKRVSTSLTWNSQIFTFLHSRTQLLADPSVITIQIYYVEETFDKLKVHRVEQRVFKFETMEILVTLEVLSFWCLNFCNGLWEEKEGKFVNFRLVTTLSVSLTLRLLVVHYNWKLLDRDDWVISTQ